MQKSKLKIKKILDRITGFTMKFEIFRNEFKRLCYKHLNFAF